MRRRGSEKAPLGVLDALWIKHWVDRPEMFEGRLLRSLGRLPDDEDVAEAERVLTARRSERVLNRPGDNT